MLFDYHRDEQARRVTITCRGDFVPGDIPAILEHIRADGTWSYPVLYDLRRVDGHPTAEQLHEILRARAAIARGVAEPRGPIALVSEPEAYTRACSVARLAGSFTTMEVFREVEEAARWLDMQSRDFGSEP